MIFALECGYITIKFSFKKAYSQIFGSRVASE